MNPRFFWKLIFQSGALTGQSLHLPNGEIAVGETPECDVQLSLPNAAGKHCVLRVSEQNIRLRPLQVRCKVNGRRIKDEEVDVTAGQRLEMGGCMFSIAQVGEHTVAFPAKSRHGIHFWGFALPSAIAVCLMALMIQAGQDLRASMPRYIPFDLESYRQALRMEAQQVKVERDETGVLTLSGACRDTSVLTPFLRRLDEAGVRYQNRMICEDDVRRNVTYILRANGYRYAQVSAGQTPGSVVISGHISDTAEWASVSRQLDRLTGLNSWTVRNDMDSTVSSLIGALRQHNLFEQLSVAYQGEFLTVTGQASPEREPLLRQVLARWQQDHQNSIRIVYQNIPVSRLEANLFPPQAQVESFSGNQRAAFLKLSDGTRVQEGSTLPSGYVVMKLDQNGIELRKEGEWVHLSLAL